MHDFLITNWPFLMLCWIGVFLLYDYSIYREEKLQVSNTLGRDSALFHAGVILSRTGHQKSPFHLKLFFASGFILFLLIFVAIFLDGKDIYKGGFDLITILGELYSNKPFELFKMVVFSVLAVIALIVSNAAVNNERLILSKAGIKYTSIFKNHYLQKLVPSWYVDWNDVESVSQGNVSAKHQFILKAKNGDSHTLQFNMWKELNRGDGVSKESLISRFIYLQKMLKDTEFSFKENILPRYIVEVVGIEIIKRPETNLNYDLTSNNYSLGAVVALFAFMLLAIIGSVVSTESYVSSVPYLWFVIIGVTVAIICGVALSKNQVPLSNALGLALLVGVMASVSSYPGILGINKLTDGRGLVEYKYRRISANTFKPVDSQLPNIDMSSDEYWSSLPITEDSVFMIRKGGLGLYQIDMEPEYKKMRKWYCLKRVADNKNTDEAEEC